MLLVEEGGLVGGVLLPLRRPCCGCRRLLRGAAGGGGGGRRHRAAGLAAGLQALQRGGRQRPARGGCKGAHLAGAECQNRRF